MYEPEYRLFYNHDFLFLTFRENEFQNSSSRKEKKVGNQYICCMYMIIRESISVYAAMIYNKLKSISFFLLSQFSVFFWLWRIIIIKNCKKNPVHFFVQSISRFSSVFWSNCNAYTFQKCHQIFSILHIHYSIIMYIG